MQLVYGPESAITLSANLLLYLIIFMLWGMAIYRARRYRLSRTLWRGVRGSLSGSSMSFSMLFFGAMLLRGLTLGWSTPAMNLNIQERMIGDMSFGNRSFLFAGPAGPLYKRFALCWFLTPVVLALAVVLVTVIFTGTTSFSFDELGTLFGNWAEQVESDSTSDSKSAWVPIAAMFMFFFAIYVTYAVLWTFYIAREMVVFASYTTFDKAGFRLDATVGSLIGLWLGNLAIMIFTLGIGQPYVLQRLVRYLCDRLSVEGTVNLAAISQSTATMDKRGEGLVEAFDIDAF
ncbi:MAG: DUF898 family protein [Aestuariivirgaceae bacterium]